MAVKAVAIVQDFFWRSATSCDVVVKFCAYDASQNVETLMIENVPPPNNANQFNTFLIDTIRDTLSITNPDTICLIGAAQVG